MKPDSLTKFSLTIIAALVLAACGSSGSGDKVVAPTTGATATTPSTTVTQPAANQADAAAKKAQAEAEAAKAAAEKAKADAEKARADAEKARADADKAKADADAAKKAQTEAEAARAEAEAARAEAEAAKRKLEAEEAARKAEVEKAKAEAEAAEKAKAEAAEKAKAEAEKAEAERAKAEANAKAKENQDRTADNANLRSTPTGSDLLQKSSVGAKVVSKQDSNAGTTVSQVQDSTASRPELLNVQEPDALFRSFVVGEATGKDGKKYALMLDQLGNLKDNPNDSGYVALAKSNSNPLLTDRQGQTKKTDKAYVKTVENQRLNYTSNYNGSLAAAYFVDTSGRDPALVVKGGTGNPARTDKTRLLEAKDKDGFLVGELYGVHANDGKSVANFIYTTGETERNAPFVRNKYQNVQYGSLTSALHNLNADEFSGYIPNTKVVPYGIKGAAYTEDNYFYRLNENNMDAESYKTFKQKHPNSVLKYEGHAVTYGLDNNWNGPVNKGDNKVVGPVVNNIPTSPLVPSTPKTPAADNFKPELFSGTHVAAQINLGDVNKVTGSIYNKWTDNTTATGYKNVRLVDFEGTMSDIGNIAGTAINNTSESSKTGLFGATLNADASEMGGIVASDKHEPAEKWGAVFGAQLTDVSAAAVFKPADATKPAVQTNGNTTIVKP